MISSLMSRDSKKGNDPIPIHEIFNCYFVFDRVSGNVYMHCDAQNDTLAVRSVLSTLRVPLKDCELYQYGTLTKNFETGQSDLKFGQEVSFTPLKQPRFVSWSCYKFPESPAETLSELGLSKDELEQIIQKF